MSKTNESKKYADPTTENKKIDHCKCNVEASKNAD